MEKILVLAMFSLIILLSYTTLTITKIDTKSNVYKILTNERGVIHHEVIQIK